MFLCSSDEVRFYFQLANFQIWLDVHVTHVVFILRYSKYLIIYWNLDCTLNSKEIQIANFHNTKRKQFKQTYLGPCFLKIYFRTIYMVCTYQ
jgi:hypothetical protein